MNEQPTTRELTVDEALAFARQQVRRLVSNHPGKLTTYTTNGTWVFAADPWAPTWSGGFLTGQLWIGADHTDDPWWAERARSYCGVVEPRKHDGGTHDLGFVFDPSWGRWFDREPTDEAAQVLIQAGRTLSGRFNAQGRYLSTWVDDGSTFIDVMMNVGLIFRAAKLGDDAQLHDIALQHSLTSHRYLQRGDGSTLHEGWFDPATGEFLRAATHQGWRGDSTWARGQAWAIYGFTTAYRYSGDGRLLQAARMAADYYIAHTPEHGVPPNDWLDPDPILPWESSAAAVAAAGMLHLAEAVEGDAATTYRGYGLRILRTLRSTEFIAADTPGWQGILRHAVYHYANRLGIDESVMWGDYYLVEALDKASRLDARGDGITE